MAGVRAVIFDLGRVLVDLDVQGGLWAEVAGVCSHRVAGRELLEDLQWRWCTGRLTPEAFHAEVCALHDLRIDRDEFFRRWCEGFSPMPAMEPLLREVAARVPVGLLSDTDCVHWPYLRGRFPFLSLFARPTLSFEVGHMKPAPEIYRAAAANVGVEPAGCFFVDDLPRNVAGARAAGMDAAQFRGPDALREDLRSRAILP